MGNTTAVTSSRPSAGYRGTILSMTAVWAGATFFYAALLMQQRQIPLTFALGLAAGRFGVLGLLGIPVWRYSGVLLDAPLTRVQIAVRHAAMGAIAIAAWMAVYFPYAAWLYGETVVERLARTPPLQYLELSLTYMLMVSGMIAAQLARLLEAQRRRATEVLSLAQEVELRALKAQIRPHFLFNVLNSIYSLIGSRPVEAREMVERLADLMRRTLDAGEERLVPVSWEMQVADSYLHIERVRLGSRLDVRIATENLPTDAQVSPLLLQPLVENAVKHGIARQPGPGRVDVLARGDGDHIEFLVRDSGPGLRGEALRVDGHGLSLTRRRLQALYGDSFSLALTNLEPRGFEVRLRIPTGGPLPDPPAPAASRMPALKEVAHA